MVHFAYEVRNCGGSAGVPRNAMFGLIVTENGRVIWEMDHMMEDMIMNYDSESEFGDSGFVLWNSKFVWFRWFDYCFHFDESIRNVLRGWKEEYLIRKELWK